MGEGDFFWDANGRNQFPKVAEDVDAQLTQYKQVLPFHFSCAIMGNKGNFFKGRPRQRRCYAVELVLSRDIYAAIGLMKAAALHCAAAGLCAGKGWGEQARAPTSMKHAQSGQEGVSC